MYIYATNDVSAKVWKWTKNDSTTLTRTNEYFLLAIFAKKKKERKNGKSKENKSWLCNHQVQVMNLTHLTNRYYKITSERKATTTTAITITHWKPLRTVEINCKRMQLELINETGFNCSKMSAEQFIKMQHLCYIKTGGQERVALKWLKIWSVDLEQYIKLNKHIYIYTRSYIGIQVGNLHPTEKTLKWWG